jgi:hypothetical protein
MSKISVELLSENPNEFHYISEAKLTNVTMGCLNTLNRLGKIGRMIEVFKITFTPLDGRWGPGSGPVFTVHFRDPLGGTSSHQTDFRFVKGKSGDKMPTTNPSAEDIADHLCEILERYLVEHATKARKRLGEMSTQLTEYLKPKQ